MKSFEELGVDRLVIDKLAEKGIREPTAVQERVLPPALAGRDLAFRSATGTGKTYAYLVPVVQGCREAGRGPAAVVCAPTYELCAQIKAEADFVLSAFEGLGKAVLLTGDANIARQIDRLKSDKPRVVVGTPGRMAQLERMGKLKLGSVRFLVLDEADRLVADELLDATRELVGRLPAERVTFACSATLSRKARGRFAPFMRGDALSEELDDSEILKSMIEHLAFYAERRKKIAALRSFLLAAKGDKTLVFIDDASQVPSVTAQLRYKDFPATGLSGGMDKVARKKAIDDFRAGRAKILVTSDLAARGLDVADVGHVVELDVPESAEAYAHRAGRTARAGRKGVMATIGDEVELRRLASLEKKLGIAVYPKVLYKGEIRTPEPVEDEDEDVDAESRGEA